MPTGVYIRKNGHWLSGTAFYEKWETIQQRCNNKNNTRYKDYWWRWIKCEWKNFIEFKNDMYESYLGHCKEFWKKDTTIDRIDNNWNYCKNNCTWSTRKEQQLNTRSVIVYEGRSLLENSKIYNICYWVAFNRIKKWWDIKKALTTPIKTTKFDFSIQYYANKYWIKVGTLAARITRWRTLEQAIEMWKIKYHTGKHTRI